MMMNDASVGKGCFSQWQHTPFHCDASDDILVEASPYDGIWGIKWLKQTKMHTIR